MKLSTAMNHPKQLEIWHVLFWGVHRRLDPLTNKISFSWNQYYRLYFDTQTLEECLGDGSINHEHINIQGFYARYRFQFVILYAFDGHLFLRIGRKVFPLTRMSLAVYEHESKYERRFRLLDENDVVCYETRYRLTPRRLKKIENPPDLYKVPEDYDIFLYIANHICRDEEKFDHLLWWWRIPKVDFSIRKSQLFINGVHVKLPSDIVYFTCFKKLSIILLDPVCADERNVIAYSDSAEPVWTIQAAPDAGDKCSRRGYESVDCSLDRPVVRTLQGELFEVDPESGILGERLEPKKLQANSSFERI